MNARPGTTYEATFTAGETGLEGTLALALLDNQNNVVDEFSTDDIVEQTVDATATGIYVATRTAPDTGGQYTLLWSLDGTADPEQTFTDELFVSSSATSGDTVEPGVEGVGPCTLWISAEDVAANCEAIENSGDPSVYDNAALEASQILYALSGRRFSGECGPVTVRPCQPRGCPPLDPCGCCHLSTVKLAGTVREITEVKIDGTVVNPSEYRVDQRQNLVRLADADGRRQHWPGCQRLDLDDSEDKTFSVSYTYGLNPPQAGLDAAASLACELAALGVSGECGLPAGTTRVTRQGVTIDLEKAPDSWWLALPLVAAFLTAYNPKGLRRRAAVYSPDIRPYAQRVGL